MEGDKIMIYDKKKKVIKWRMLQVRSRLEKDMETLRKEKKQLVEDNHVSTRMIMKIVMMIKDDDFNDKEVDPW